MGHFALTAFIQFRGPEALNDSYEKTGGGGPIALARQAVTLASCKEPSLLSSSGSASGRCADP